MMMMMYFQEVPKMWLALRMMGVNQFESLDEDFKAKVILSKEVESLYFELTKPNTLFKIPIW